VNVNPDDVLACVTGEGLVVVPKGSLPGASCTKMISIGSSAFEGWTPEQSRCANHSTLIRVRLGPDRLMQTECAAASFHP
jgi:hypothetical protein